MQQNVKFMYPIILRGVIFNFDKKKMDLTMSFFIFLPNTTKNKFKRYLVGCIPIPDVAVHLNLKS